MWEVVRWRVRVRVWRGGGKGCVCYRCVTFHLNHPFVSFLEWYGAYQSEDIASCIPTLQTRVSNNASQWRSIAYDSTNAVIYFCDPKMRREVKGLDMACFSSADGTTWAGKTKRDTGTETQRDKHRETEILYFFRSSSTFIRRATGGP